MHQSCAALTQGSNINSHSTITAAHSRKEDARHGRRNGRAEIVAMVVVLDQGRGRGRARKTGSTESQPQSLVV
jgi:hypothetical protein